MPSSSCPILIQTVLRGILLLCLLTPQSGFPHPACGDEKAVDTTADAVPFADTDPASPWYPHRDFPHLKTPEWAGDAETKAVIVLAIDDMRDSAKYEQYLRPILNRLKQIDGRAPLSIMTNQILPADSQLQSWLGEGVTIECHTADHPCPLLNDGDLEKARSTYNRCVDQMAQIPGNQPVAFRTPCCDSLNTVSPRFFSEIFSGTTDAEQFLQIDSSVFMFYTSADPRHDRELVLNDAGEDRFLRYLPTANHFRGLNNDHFVNYVRDYPWPWVVNGDCWEIPCLAPSDWSAQHLQGVNNPRTLEDWKAAIDLTVAAEGCFSLVFHPHGWIQAEQVVELIDHAVSTHGNAVRFMNFREVASLLNRQYCDGGNLRTNPPTFLADWSLARDRSAAQTGALSDADTKLLQQILNTPEQYDLPPVRRADGSHNGFFIHDQHLCWQNEDTSGKADLLERIAIPTLLQRVRRDEARRDYPLTPVGAAVVDITPDYPVRLTGYGNRREEAVEAAARIHARSLAIGEPDNLQTLLLTVDNCGIPAEMTEAIYRRIAAKIDLPRERFSISATHSHAAPWLRGFAPNIFAEIPAEHADHLARYEQELSDQLVDVALKSLQNMQPATLSLGFGHAGFAMNRRALSDGKWSGFGEVPEGPVDQRVPLLAAHNADGELVALLVNYACHCTTEGSDFNRISGDWAGVAADMLEAEFPGAVALVAIGCGADANPSPRGTHEQGKVHGRVLADEVIRLLTSTRLKRINPEVTCQLDRIDLPLTQIPDRAALEAQAEQGGVTASRARYFLELLNAGKPMPQTVPDYTIQTWCFGQDLAMVFLAGEVVVDYAIRLNEMLDGPRLWINAYSNDVPCYIASARILREGGYETDSSMLYYRRSGRLAPQTEDLICDTVQRLLPRQYYSADLQQEFPAPQDPETARDSFKVRPGLQVVLAAAEPLIRDPVAFDWDHRGRLWVVEMGDYPLGNGPHRGRVQILEDTDGDYRYDKAVTFLDNLAFPSGIQCWQNGAIISMAPEIFYAEDTDSDGNADLQETLYRGFAEGNQQHRVNGLRWGLDGWLYLANGDSGGSIAGTGYIPGQGPRQSTFAPRELRGRDLRIDPRSNALQAISGQSQFARERDDFGNWFGNNNSNPIWHYQFEERYLARNPHSGISGSRAVVSAVPGAAPVYPASRTLARFNDFAASNRFTSACGTMIFRSQHLGAEIYGSALTSEPVHNLVSRLVMSPLADDSRIGFLGVRAGDEQESEFLASTDNWFRPTMLRTGPDGALWVADMYRAVIEHPEWIPAEYQRRMNLSAGTDRGRIWRVIPAGSCCGEASLDSPAAETVDVEFQDLDWQHTSVSQLLRTMKSSNGWWRDLAHRLLSHHAVLNPEQLQQASSELLKTTAAGGAAGVQSLYAFSQLQGKDQKTAKTEALAGFLQHEDPQIRRAAIELLEPTFADKDQDFSDHLKAAVTDDNLIVRRQLLLSLGESHAPWAARLLGQALVAAADQPVLVSCGLTSLHHENITVVMQTVGSSTASPASLRLTRLLLPQAAQLGAGAEAARQTAQLLKAVTNAASAATYAELTGILRDVLRDESARTALSTPELRQLREESSAAAMQLALSPDEDSQRRLAALEYAAAVSDTLVSADEAAQLLSPTTDPTLQRSLVKILAASDDHRQVADIAASFQQLSPSVRSELLEQMIQRPPLTELLLDQIAEQRITPAELSARNRQTLIEHPEAAIAERARQLLNISPGSDLQELIDEYLTRIEQHQGQPEQGAEVFRKHCSACHRYAEIGREIGADLAALRDRSAGALLTAIIDPNRAVESKFLSYSVLTLDGLQLTGMLQNESGSSVTLLSADGRQQVVPRSEIELLQTSGKSLMPEGLHRDLSAAQLGDVIAFLQQGQRSWKEFPGNQPQLVMRDADGNVVLQAAHAEIHGPSLVFETQYRNLGYWSSLEDYAVWNVEVPEGGHWTLELNYACDDQTAGGLIRFSTGTRMLTSRVPGTGTWDDYQVWNAGTLDLRRGRNRITATALSQPRNALIDLHSIRLIPPSDD